MIDLWSGVSKSGYASKIIGRWFWVCYGRKERPRSWDCGTCVKSMVRFNHWLSENFAQLWPRATLSWNLKRWSTCNYPDRFVIPVSIKCAMICHTYRLVRIVSHGSGDDLITQYELWTAGYSGRQMPLLLVSRRHRFLSLACSNPSRLRLMYEVGKGNPGRMVRGRHKKVVGNKSVLIEGRDNSAKWRGMYMPRRW